MPLLYIAAVIVIIIAAVAAFYMTRFMTMASVSRITDYDDYNIYTADIKYSYSLDRIAIARPMNDAEFANAARKCALPFVPVKIKTPSFGCSAFIVRTAKGEVITGRNYDFRNNTSALVVRCHPKNGYASLGLAALDNIKANAADASLVKRAACLTAPFICLEGLNEKGVAIAVLILDSEPTRHDTGKPTLTTTLAIRLVLDRAATTQEAVDLLRQYDMRSTAGRDYHFYISDASGDGRVVEYDCMDASRPLVDVPSVAATNFFALYADKALPNRKNGVFGHGRERYDSVLDMLALAGKNVSENTVWGALRVSSQDPVPGVISGNTQWSVAYSNTKKTASIVLRRRWEEGRLPLGGVK